MARPFRPNPGSPHTLYRKVRGVPDRNKRADAGRAVAQNAAVIGPITLRTSVILVAGNPLSFACSRTAASSSAR